MHIGAILAIAAAIVVAFMMGRTLRGFEIRVIGTSPRAGSFAGFKGKRVVLFCFMLSGALAGLAGICEVAGPSGQLQPNISPGYGFTAIIVAFLGRLNPIGVFFAGVLLAISYMGGEGVQVILGISDKTTQVFQGMLLFLILACDTLIRYVTASGSFASTGCSRIETKMDARIKSGHGAQRLGSGRWKPSKPSF